MWCPQCRSDVATEVAADGQSLLCTTCGSEVRKTFAPSLHPDVRRARDVLARLSRENAESGIEPAEAAANPARSDKPTPSASERPDAKSDRTGAGGTRENVDPFDAPDRNEAGGMKDRPRQDALDTAAPASPMPRPSRQFRIDAAHPEAAPAHVSPPHRPAQAHRPEAATAKGVVRREDDAHAVIPPPHFDVAAAARAKSPGRSESIWGQLMAYFGVAVLTVGTALVLWGYFGGPPAYAPTGWLVTTAGQMLLLLGVITLVSGGMQQTTHEVASRVAHLDGRMHRIETTAHELLRGPHFSHAARRSASASESDDAAESQL